MLKWPVTSFALTDTSFIFDFKISLPLGISDLEVQQRVTLQLTGGGNPCVGPVVSPTIVK